MEHITDREIEVMRALWQGGGQAVTTGFLLGLVPACRNPYQSLHMVLNRLSEKGLLACERSRPANLYRPLVSREAVLAARVDLLCGQFFSGSRAALAEYLRGAEDIQQGGSP